jgi:hypothetical protein
LNECNEFFNYNVFFLVLFVVGVGLCFLNTILAIRNFKKRTVNSRSRAFAAVRMRSRAFATVRSRSPPFATVRGRSQWFVTVRSGSPPFAVVRHRSRLI